uniref:DUF4116 domain-containing protein n=1 Tax=viral metagenome TaxID=1070528 RepID=A0A6C0BP57_9ZZZZ
MCMLSVKSKPCNLTYVPPEKLTLEMCLAAVERNGYCLVYVPPKFGPLKF